MDGWRSCSYVRGVATTAAKLVLVVRPARVRCSRYLTVLRERGTVIKNSSGAKSAKDRNFLVVQKGQRQELYVCMITSPEGRIGMIGMIGMGIGMGMGMGI